MRRILTAAVIAMGVCACDKAQSGARELEQKAEHGAAQLRDKAEQAWEKLGDLTAGTKDDAQSKLDLQLERLSAKLEQFASEAETKGAAGREKLVAELRAQRERAATKLQALRDGGAERWKELCAEAQRESEQLVLKCRNALEGD